MQYSQRVVVYMVLLFVALFALFNSPDRQLSWPVLSALLAVMAGLSYEYLTAKESSQDE